MSDALASESFVRHVLDVGRHTTTSIKDAVAMATGEALAFDDSDDTCLTVSLAILGFSLATLRSHSPMMDPQRGRQIGEYCKSVFRRKFDIPSSSSQQICNSIDVFADSFETSVGKKENPIGKAVVPLLRRCLGNDFDRVTMGDGQMVSPFVGDMVADLLTMSLTQSLAFWKDA
jgi:hypothetical protein